MADSKNMKSYSKKLILSIFYNVTLFFISINNTPPTCRFYMKGKCKHDICGKNCQYTHPKACPKLMKEGNKGPRGCNAVTNCAQFHPRMSSSSIKSGTCFNIHCTFAHIKGTRSMLKKSDLPTKNHRETNDSLDFLKILSPANDLIHQRKSQTTTTNLPYSRSVQAGKSTTIQNPSHNFTTTSLVEILKSENHIFLGLTETWLSKGHNEVELEIDGYKLFRKDRNRKKSRYGRYRGGVAFYLQDDIAPLLEPLLEFSNGVNEALLLYSEQLNVIL
eukprot:TCONS_00072005-protein